ncbi:MAG TPA: histidine kinase [Solirubrobacteraceae bacterium]|nr:histidine kinase [Solirubrobacteraceae bacterium]
MSRLAIAVAGGVASIAVVAPTLVSEPAATTRTAVPVFVIGAGVVFGLGLSDLLRVQDSRFARAVVAAGALWSLSALATSSEPTAYSVGRVSYWLVNVALVYLLLSYPSGRLTESLDRTLFAAILIVVMLYLPTALIAQHFPSPSVWSLCASHCPSNAFALGHSTPALVKDLVVPLREVLTVAVFLAVPVAVWRHRRRAGPLLHGMYVPIAVIAGLQAVTFGAVFAVRHAAPTSSALQVAMWLNVLALPAVGVACAAGRVYRRLLTANALERLARELTGSVTATQVSRAVAVALEDPLLKILRSFPGEQRGWVDESGAPFALNGDRARQEVTEVATGQWRIAIVHDPVLAEHRALVQSAGSYALAALENDHLISELRSSLEALAESRARASAVEHRERRKLERDLHDGAQQRLIALRIKLAVAAEQLADDDSARAETIRALGEDVEATIDEVRSFARGVYPAVLAQTGLAGALRSAGPKAGLPTTVSSNGLGRYAPDVETTAYFFCSEALQNAAKHARGATEVTISLWADRELHFEVHDDGAGFDVQTTPFGTGLRNLGDRLAAVGGAMTIRSSPDHGTSIEGSIPLT